MKPESKNAVLELSFIFALQIIEFCELLEAKNKLVIARQLLKSGTSIGAMINESQSAESRNDFIHKLKIASKEAEETKYWLKLCDLSKNYPSNEFLIQQVHQIIKLLTKIIYSTKQNT
ncbi:MAG: four helix bundle protein [Bacteroidales bacterium]